MDPSTTDSACPAPPPEKCCTRLIEKPGAKLRVQFADGEDRAISSITLWDATGGPLSTAHVSNAVISVGSADMTMTGCFLAGSPSASPPPPGFQGRDVVCGASGAAVVLSFPDITSSWRGKLAVKLCTLPADWDVGNSTLWVKTLT